MNHTIYVGTYSHPELFGPERGFEGRGRGIYRLTFDSAQGKIVQEHLFDGILNPSFLTLSSDGERLYCVHELDEGQVSAYAIENASLRLLGSQPTHGGAPCHVVLRPGGALLAVSNYSGGNFSIYPIAADGAPGAPQTIQHTGHGPNQTRQAAPHVHSAIFTPDGAHLITADLGTDLLTAYPVTNTGVVQADARTASVQPGGGPRMCAYAPGNRVLYIACEMASTLAAFVCDATGVPTKWLFEISTLPEGTGGEHNTAADLRLSKDGRFLYASTRGHNSLSVFAVQTDGGLSLLQTIPCGGKTPRGFALSPDGGWLLCGNQDSDTITVFEIDKAKGILALAGEYPLPSPVCLVFAP